MTEVKLEGGSDVQKGSAEVSPSSMKKKKFSMKKVKVKKEEETLDSAMAGLKLQSEGSNLTAARCMTEEVL